MHLIVLIVIALFYGERPPVAQVLVVPDTDQPAVVNCMLAKANVEKQLASTKDVKTYHVQCGELTIQFDPNSTNT